MAREPYAALRTFARGSLNFSKNYVCFYFLYLLQSVEILQNVALIASVPYSNIFASHSKKNYDVTEA